MVCVWGDGAETADWGREREREEFDGRENFPRGARKGKIGEVRGGATRRRFFGDENGEAGGDDRGGERGAGAGGGDGGSVGKMNGDNGGGE